MVRYRFGNYFEYMRDNPKGYWFKRKLYGLGWVPVTWQGWVVTLSFVVLLVCNALYLGRDGEPSLFDLKVFFTVLVIGVAVLIGICFAKGEDLKWTWGRTV